MGYYHITLTSHASQLCTIVFPWGKYQYLRLPMGIKNAPDIFHEAMSNLMQGLKFVRVYLDDLLCLTKGGWTDHLDKLKMVLQHILDVGLKINAKKSFFRQTELEYLGFWINRDGICPLTEKVEAIQNIQPPKT